MPRDGRRDLEARGVQPPALLSRSGPTRSLQELPNLPLKSPGSGTSMIAVTSLEGASCAPLPCSALHHSSQPSAAVVIYLTIIAPWGFSRKDLLPTLIACFIAAAWDAAEFSIMYVRGGRRLPWWSQIAVDGAIVVGVAIAAGFSFANLSWLIKMYREYDLDEDGEVAIGEVACLALSVLLILVHICLVVFLFSANVRRRAKKQKTEPKIVHLPTGDAVVVTQEPAITPATTAPSPTSATPPGDPGTTESIQEPFRQDVPPRKPVAGTHCVSPWPGPDYQPDEAERARAARGERQAQWMTVQAKGLRQERGVMENVPGRQADQGSSSAGRGRA